MKYIIQTDMNTGKHFQPLFWTGTEVVGVFRSDETKTYDSREDAKAALTAILPDVSQFHNLHVRLESKRSRLPRASRHGWMKGHPGYDLG